jgi:UDP-3-O-[3-hydroxymyristoyl] glucosamine N-acyltransferase
MAGPELTMASRRLSDVASRYGLELRGGDREIVTVGPLSSSSSHRDRLLTFVSGERWMPALAESGIGAAVVPEALAEQAPEGVSLLVTSGDPQAFFTLLVDTAEAGEWERLEGSIGERTVIAPSAVVEDGVVIGEDCVVMAGAVVLANTRLGDRVVVKPNSVLGGEGFQVREIRGRRRIVPHTGGVHVGDDGAIGSQTCVDRGLFGDFTTVGEGSFVDNLVHVAHSVRIGRRVSVVACAEISGSVRIGDGVWLGPNVAINPSLTLGAHCFVGTGSVIVRDVPPHALVYGNPARVGGWMCSCQTKLALDGEDATCPACGRRYRLDGQRLVAL